MNNFKEELMNVKAFAFDVDGVFSNCHVYLHPDGDMMRTMNIKDGYAIQCAVNKGYPVCIITGGFSESVRLRFKGLGVFDVYLNSKDKLENLKEFCEKYKLGLDKVLYMGDDIPDYKVMIQTGVPTCPSDAVQEIKSVAMYISDHKGGEGCVRDVVEQVLRAQGNWFKA
ncbi:MAG: HAD hydrolase family protein [Bacteroidia bacterium]|nr:HAD hydrolase family protein [Bacteroidia bacterium]